VGIQTQLTSTAIAYLHTYKRGPTPPSKRLGKSISWCLLFVFEGFYEDPSYGDAFTC
jgi:hypothetical protein